MVQNPGFKVFAVSALGAFIGSLVGLQLTPMFWWVGMLIGGVVGYFAYNVGEVMRALPQAWILARDVWDEIVCVDYLGALRAFGSGMAKVLQVLGLAVVLIPVAAVAIMLVGGVWTLQVFTPVAFYQHDSFPHFFVGTPEYFINTLIVSAAAGVIVCVITLCAWSEMYGLDAMRRRKGWCALLLLYKATPLGAITWYLPKSIWLVLPLLPASARFVGAFWWNLFKIIHSDRRLLCGVDAAIGAAVGIFAHNPLLGALAGGVVGVLNFELISKRWLKLVPAA